MYIHRGAAARICTDETFLSENSNKESRKLFCFSAMSNFNGRKYPLAWINKIHNLRNDSYVLLDAASFVSTNPLNLGKDQPDFVVISFYKMFGFPSGLGALLIKNSSVGVLKKTYFGGGTVDLALVRKNVQYLRKNVSHCFEDGTVDYLGKT